MPHLANWFAGWSMILASFLIGAVLGLFFHQENFLGGYTSWPRRLLRLGHIALAALGLFNVVFASAALPVPGSWQSSTASLALILGGTAMPAVCFLSAWKKPLKALFFIPVLALLTATVCCLLSETRP